MVISVLNIDRLKEKFEDVKGVDLRPYMKIAGLLVQRTARELAPKDTGDLTRSIVSRDGGSGIEAYSIVSTNLEYAPYQEFGYTRKIKKGEALFGGLRTAKKNITVNYAGKPYMRPALKLNTPIIEEGIAEFIQSYLSRIAK